MGPWVYVIKRLNQPDIIVKRWISHAGVTCFELTVGIKEFILSKDDIVELFQISLDEPIDKATNDSKS